MRLRPRYPRRASYRRRTYPRPVPSPRTSLLTSYRTGASVTGWAPQIYMTHRYHENVFFDPTGSSPSWITYQINNMFSPRVGGHQPYGFDQMSVMYKNYLVTSVEIKVAIFATNPVTLIIHPQHDDTTVTNFGNTCELPGAIVKHINGGSTGSASCQAKCTVNLADFFCLPMRDFIRQPDYGAPSYVAPNILAFVKIYLQPGLVGSDIPNTGGVVEIKFRTLWTNPHTLISS